MSNESMSVGLNGLNLLKSFEGFAAKRYLCPAGKPTIGYGKVIAPNDPLWNATISEPEATALLARDLIRYERMARAAVKVELNQNQFDAVVSWIYNCGVPGNNSRTLAALNSYDFPAFCRLLLTWNKAVDPKTGKMRELTGLTRRRLVEMELFQKPVGGESAPA